MLADTVQMPFRRKARGRHGLPQDDRENQEFPSANAPVDSAPDPPPTYFVRYPPRIECRSPAASPRATRSRTEGELPRKRPPRLRPTTAPGVSTATPATSPRRADRGIGDGPAYLGPIDGGDPPAGKPPPRESWRQLPPRSTRAERIERRNHP